MTPPVVEVRNLGIGLDTGAGRRAAILRDVALSIAPGETVGLVGESGCGKSTLALAMMGFLRPGLQRLGGQVVFAGHDMLALSEDRLQRLRGGRIALVPQSASQSLAPNLRIGAQIGEALALHTTLPREQRRERCVALLSQVRLPDPATLLARFPHQLSGGQQQRVAIAMALAGEPDLLLLDEPTTGLDVTTQAHILELLKELAAATGTAMIYISHDIGVIARVCRRVAVMYAGEIVEDGKVRDVLRRPSHPYTRGLLLSIPRLAAARLPVPMAGQLPRPGSIAAGCAFADRCPVVLPRCRALRPALAADIGGTLVRCHRAGELVPFAPSLANAPPAPPPPAPPPPAPPPTEPAAPSDALLDIDGLAVTYRPRRGLAWLSRRPSGPAVVSEFDLLVRDGETVALVGESGSGKSTVLRVITGLLPALSGRLSFGPGRTLDAAAEARPLELCRRIQLIFQNPDDSLNPRQSVAEILAQPLRLYFRLRGAALRRRSIALLESVRLDAHYLERLPGQLSGGEKQRVAIARAFAAEPSLVLCDEVTASLDVSVQAAILRMLAQLCHDRGTTYVFVSHDLAVVRALADRVAVLYQGRICESGTSAQVYASPFHPYTEALLGAVLEPDPDRAPVLPPEDNTAAAAPARGCPFQRRCPRRLGPVCDETMPPLRQAEEGHVIRCHIEVDDLRRRQSGAAPAASAAPAGGRPSAAIHANAGPF